ncbi:Ger(x)C family spore germination protein [Bacillus sp. DNRA2]|uniref:Ger(x)C family spore germination protein n=1 Tax=Bacillus sp. DNRA2 TaxID=2723053 RepID=UPI00145FA9B3|nr:Ger(x)C family spore germination protein [Bacillus sp. DNRA2]
MKENGEKNKSILIVLLFTIMTILLSGCFRGELDERLILSSLGIDRTEDNKVKVTVSLIDTRSVDKQEAKGVKIYSSVGDTIFDAVRSTIIKLGKQPIWPYIKIVVLGPTVTQDNILPFLDFLNRNNEVQPNPFILISKVDAAEFIKAKPDFTTVPSTVIEKQLSQKNTSYIPTIRLHQFTEMMLSSDQIGYLAIVETVKKGAKNIPKAQNTAVIKKGKWIGKLNNTETRGLLWVKEEVTGGILVINALKGSGKIGLEILDKTKVNIKPQFEGSRLKHLTIDAKATVSVGEMLTQYTALTEGKINKIEKLAAKEIEAEILAAIAKAKGYKADIFGFGAVIHRKNPQFWKKNKQNWNEQFTELPVYIDVKVDIRNLGLFNY